MNGLLYASATLTSWKASSTHWIWGWMGFGSSLSLPGVENKFYVLPALYIFAVLTELTQANFLNSSNRSVLSTQNWRPYTYAGSHIMKFQHCHFPCVSSKSVFSVDQCFSTFVRPRPGKFFFIRRGPGPNEFTRNYLSNFFKFIH
jgi:hypothetical protein